MRRRVAAEGSIREAVMEHLRSREASWQARNIPQMARYYRRPLDRILAGEPVDFDAWQLSPVVPALTASDGRWRLQPDGELLQLPSRRPEAVL